MRSLTEEGRQLVAAMALRHGVSDTAVCQLLEALAAGGGSQAQFNHPQLGGMGQWSQGGMIMIGDMFNQALKYQVDALCNDLATAFQNAALFQQTPTQPQHQSRNGAGVSLFVTESHNGRWPAELGAPASSGSQNNLHYAVFPATRRLAIEQGGKVTIYDTGDHQISGFSQQQGGDQSLTFTSQNGLVRLAELKVMVPVDDTSDVPTLSTGPHCEPPTVKATSATPAKTAPVPSLSDDEIFSRIERLADLRQKDIITAEEFAAKKAELLARL